jgi:uncharacterized protein involved in exopolysaccharide biosynthesis/Mrp family chromosome partitioning ATPase
VVAKVNTSNHKSQRINIGLVLKRHYKKIVLLGVLTFMIVAPLVYLSNKKTYSAYAELRIDPMYASMVPGNDISNSISGFYDAYVSTQKFKILKEQNIEKALNALDSKTLGALLGGAPINKLTVEQLTNRISVIPARDSLILSVGVTGGKPEGLAEFLNNVINGYLEELRNEKESQESSRIGFTDKQKTELEAKIASDEAALKQISEEISTGNFNPENVPFQNELRIQEESMIKAQNDRILKEKQYNEFVSQIEKISSMGGGAQIEERIRGDVFYADQKRNLLSKIESATNQLANMSTENTARRELESNIVNLRDQLQSLETTTKEKYKKQVDSENATSLEKQRLSLYRDYIVAKQFEDAVKASYDNLKSKYSFSSKRILTAKGLEEELANLRTELAKVNSSLTYFQGEQQTTGRVTVENYATTPLVADKSTVSKNLIIALLMSFMWIIGAVFLYEIFDQRVKSPEELKSFTGIKPSWPISHYSGNFATVTIRDQESVVNKAIKSLATRINQERINYQTKIVSFSGVNAQTGATEILLNCAYIMKHNCEKVLVIDLAHEHQGIASKLDIPMKSQPLVRTLAGSSLDKLVFHDVDRDIDVLTILDLEQLDNKNLDRILELAKNEYEIVLLDAAPILKSSNTEHIFMMSDTVIFVVRGNKSLFPDIRHTLELAEKFGVTSAGLVLNWWKESKQAKKKNKAKNKSV